jgi:D-alanyl-D-alanine carboxypeptidase (penicillin-binding protein 5/6)
MLRKMLSTALVFILLGGAFPVAASDFDIDPYAALTGVSDEEVEYRDTTADAAELPLDAAAVILVEKETGEVLYEENADELRPVASITKVMTLILVMEALESGAITLEDDVVCSEHAYSMGGSQIWMEPGEVFSVDELLRAVAIASANDAAVALAEHVSGGEDTFVGEMNRKAQELGMTNTTFKNANGLDEEGHLSTARDVALMSREILKHELVRNYITVWMDELRGGETELTNTNKMLKSFNGITGIKTGTTSKAGVCISASAQREDMELIAVVLGSSNSQGRFSAASSLLEYGFANYELAELRISPEDTPPIKIKLGELEYCEYEYDVPAHMVVDRGKKDSVSYVVEMAETLTAPVEQGQLMGEITVYSEGIVIGSYPITATQRVEVMTFGSAFGKLCDALFGM